MGRLLFAVVLGIVALLYLWLAFMALFTPGGFMAGDPLVTIGGLIVFLIMGVAAAAGSLSLLKEKSNR